MADRIAVVKIGGSVLTGRAGYRRAAGFLARRLCDAPAERVVCVVSAEHGMTDALLDEARDIAGDPDASTLDLLWSTGELRSAAILALHLQRIGVSAVGLNVHEAGLLAPDEARGHASPGLRALRVRAALAHADVAIVPGFLSTDAGDRVVSLGRGGSDLTAVVVAVGLRAACCELVKDVPGYFSSDPNRDRSARHVAAIDYATALAMADAGCDLVQRQALELARACRLPLVIRAIAGTSSTLVHENREPDPEPLNR